MTPARTGHLLQPQVARAHAHQPRVMCARPAVPQVLESSALQARHFLAYFNADFDKKFLVSFCRFAGSLLKQSYLCIVLLPDRSICQLNSSDVHSMQLRQVFVEFWFLVMYWRCFREESWVSNAGVICPPGDYCLNGTGVATPCPAGRYNASFGAANVTSCNTCTATLSGYVCGQGGTRPNGTLCPPGTYANVSLQACIQ